VKELVIIGEYGREIVIPEEQYKEWMDDLPQEIDEVMSAPLTVGSRLAWYAPEVVREKVTKYVLEGKAADASMRGCNYNE
jgi:hypothetical protein